MKAAYFIIGVVQGTGYNVIDMLRECTRVMSEKEVYIAAKRGEFVNVRIVGSKIKGVYMSLSNLPVVAESKKKTILYALREQSKTKYVYSNADATVIGVVSAGGVRDNKSDFVNVSWFLTGSSGDIVSKKGLNFPYFNDIMECANDEKAVNNVGLISEVALGMSEGARLDGSMDYTTNSAYISAYIKRKKQIDVLNKTHSKENNIDSVVVSNTISGFDIAKQRHDMYIKELNK